MGVDPKEIPLPHEFLINRNLMAQIFPSFELGLRPFFTFNWAAYSDFLTFKGGLNPQTGSLQLSQNATQKLLASLGGHVTHRRDTGLTVFFPISESN